MFVVMSSLLVVALAHVSFYGFWGLCAITSYLIGRSIEPETNTQSSNEELAVISMLFGPFMVPIMIVAKMRKIYGYD